MVRVYVERLTGNCFVKRYRYAVVAAFYADVA